MAQSKTNFSIKDSFEQLEKIANEFESSEIDLDHAIPKFEEAVKISKKLKKRLNEIEFQVEKISMDEADESKLS